MDRIALIGYNGVIGKKIDKKIRNNYIIDRYNTTNIEQLENKEYDIVICAAPTSQKLKVNREIIDIKKSTYKLTKAISKVKVKKNFILISSKSAIVEINTNYGKLQKIVLDSVTKTQKYTTIYLLDVLYDETLEKGFINDLITKQWNYLEDKKITKELTPYYKKINNNLFERTKEVPKELLNTLPAIENIYSDDEIYEITSIDELVKEVIENINTPKSGYTKISSRETYTGKEIKEIVKKRKQIDNSKLSEYVRKRRKNE